MKTEDFSNFSDFPTHNLNGENIISFTFAFQVIDFKGEENIHKHWKVGSQVVVTLACPPMLSHSWLNTYSILLLINSTFFFLN